MSFVFLLMILGAAFAVGFFVRRHSSAGARVAEPSCGKCNYCVRGLTTMTCPECGSDLREVGIRTPGSVKPMTRGMRVVVWTLFAPLPAFVGAQMISQSFTPWLAVNQQQRVVFVQSQKVFVTLRAQQESKQTVLGRRGAGTGLNVPTTMQTMTLMIDGNRSATPNPLEVDLASGASRFADATGKAVVRPGPFDAAAIEQWLNVHGFTDPAVAPLSADVLTALQEMGTPAGRGFSRFASNPQRGNVPEITAHPTFGGFTTYQPTKWGPFVLPATAVLIWLLGLPFVLLLGRRPKAS